MMRNMCWLIAVLGSAMPCAVGGSDEPLVILSYPYQQFFEKSTAQQLLQWADSFSVDEASGEVFKEEITGTQAHVDEKYIRGMSASAIADIHHVTSKGSVIEILCWKVSGPEAAVTKCDEYLGRVGGAGTIVKQDGFVFVRGPQTITMRDGNKEVSGWLPMIVFYHQGWLFQSSDEEFANWKPSGDLVDRLNRVADKSWFRESRPTKVSKNNRQALLAGTFAALGTRQQRLDGESDAAFAKRAAPSALWEKFLRTQFFHTDSISGWRSSIEEGQKVRYFYEVTAEEGSEFAVVLKKLRNRTLMSSPESSWCSAAVSFKLPTVIGSQLANLIPTDIPDPMAQRLAFEIARSLQSGSLHLGSWLQRNDDGKILNGVTGLVPAEMGDAILDGSVSSDEDSTGNVFARQEITADGLLETQLGQVDPTSITPDSQPSGSGALPVLFSAKLNVLELAQIGKDTDEFDLYEFIQDKYLRYLSPNNPKLPFSIPYKLRPEDREVLDALREKIIGDDAERWTISVSVSVHSRKRQLAVRISVGDQLYGFLTVAEEYWAVAANRAINMRNFGQ